MPNTIVLKGDLGRRREEYPAAAALKPGHFLEGTSTGKVQKNATAGADRPLMIAVEDSYQGKTINDAYAADDVVHVHLAQKGDVLYGRVAAGLAALAIAAVVKLQNDGTVIPQGGTGKVIATVEEAVDNSAGVTEAFVKLRVA